MLEQKLGNEGFSYWHGGIDSALLKLFVERVEKETWQSLPTEDRKSLRTHWNGSQIPIPAKIQEAIGTSPRIECFDGVLPGEPESVSGLCTDVGHTFKFNLNKISKMPPKHSQTLIAHEFAHSYMYSEPSELVLVLKNCGSNEPFNGNWYDFHRVWVERPDQRLDWLRAEVLDNVLEHRALEINRKWGNNEDALTEWGRLDALNNLSELQKAVMCQFERINDRPKFPMDEVIKGLLSKKVICCQHPGYGNHLPIFKIQDWAWDIIQKHPELIRKERTP